MMGQIPPFFTPGGGFGVTGSSSAGWTFNRSAKASTAEVIATFKTTDAPSGALFVIENASTTDALFRSQLRGVGDSTRAGIYLTGQGTTDTGTEPFIQFIARVSTSSVPAVRPSFQFVLGSGTVVMTMTAKGKMDFTPTTNTSGAISAFAFTSPADTNQTLSTEIPGFIYNTFTRSWATGAITTQREFLVKAPTYAFTGASTITDAATLVVDSAPIAGTNASLTRKFALWVQAGLARFDGGVVLGQDGPTITTGTGSPESVVAASIGSMFLRTDGGAGTCLYIKESGAGTNTGWIAK